MPASDFARITGAMFPACDFLPRKAGDRQGRMPRQLRQIATPYNDGDTELSLLPLHES